MRTHMLNDHISAEVTSQMPQKTAEIVAQARVQFKIYEKINIGEDDRKYMDIITSGVDDIFGGIPLWVDIFLFI